jgi:hypothetical protein
MKRINLFLLLLLSTLSFAQSWQSKDVVRIENTESSFHYTFYDSTTLYIQKQNVSYIVSLPNSNYIQVGYLYEGATSKIMSCTYNTLTQPILSSNSELVDTLNAWLNEPSSGGGGGGGSGTVTSVSVITTNGISGTVANSTTTPAITLQVDTISKFATRKQLLDSIDRINTAINTKQETLISGTNIKTVNSNSILGSGNITVSGDSSSLSGLKNATTASTLANGTNVITWNWSGLSAGTKGMIFGGTDILVNGITIGVGKNQNTSNVAIGNNALNASTGGLYNTAIGSNALNKLTNGLANTAIGESSLGTLTTGTNNIAIGRQALAATSDGVENIGIGDFALTSMGTAGGNVAIGRNALANLNTGYFNVAVGNAALVATKGGNNTGIGHNAGYNLTTGTNNTIIGYYTGLGITTGGKNTIIGASISGLATTLSNTIILADGDGVIRYYCNSAGSTGIGTTTPNASAKLDVSSTTQGVLLPRMTTTQKNAISSPAEGLEVYDLTLHQKSYYNGTTWINY